jgi:hypothetical protein
VQVARGRRDVRLAHQTVDGVDDFFPAHESRGMAVTPPVGKVLSGHARRGPGLCHQLLTPGPPEIA